MKLQNRIEEINRYQVMDLKFDILMLHQLKLIEDKELVSLYKMIKSPDEENLVLAEETIKGLFNNYKP